MKTLQFLYEFATRQHVSSSITNWRLLWKEKSIYNFLFMVNMFFYNLLNLSKYLNIYFIEYLFDLI